MIKINNKKNLNNALTLNPIERIPCLSFSALNLTKEIKKLGLSYHYDDNPEQIAKISAIGYEKVGFEAISLPFNLFFEAEAMGLKTEQKGNTRTKIITTPFDEITDITLPENFTNNDKFTIKEKTIEILHEKYDDKEIPIIVPMIGPFTLLSQLYSSNIEGVIKHVNTDIVSVEDAIWNITTGLLEEIDFYNDLNVDCIVIFEPNATTSLLEPPLFKDMLKPHLEELANNNEVPSILHVCGNTKNNLKNLLTSGFEAISIESEISVNEAKQLQAELNTPTRICGNLSTSVLHDKRPKEIFEKTYQILSEGIDILSPNCVVSPNTPIRNIKAMIDARNKFCDIEA